jgi:hypothetical protein
MNVLSATPELYPGSHYDPQTGSMVADRPPNPFLGTLETLIPQTAAIDGMIGMTDQMRNLKRNNPDAYTRRLHSILGLPFMPEAIHKPLEIELSQMKRYKDAQDAISQAIQGGDFKKAKRFEFVPVPSLMRRFFPNQTYARPGDLERAYKYVVEQAASQGVSGVSPHAILPKPTRRRTRG